MPIDPIGAYFPPPVRVDPDRPHRVEKTDRDGRAGRKPEPRAKRRRPQPEPGDENQDERHISVQA